jgi:hypothetical protein
VQEQCITKNENVLRKENIRKEGEGGGGSKKTSAQQHPSQYFAWKQYHANAIAIYIVDYYYYYYYYYSPYKGESAIIEWDNKHCYICPNEGYG